MNPVCVLRLVDEQHGVVGCKKTSAKTPSMKSAMAIFITKLVLGDLKFL